MSSTATNNHARQGRIPTALQTVFLASNRGKEVNKPPPNKAGVNNWFIQKMPGSFRKIKTGFTTPSHKQEACETKSCPEKSLKTEVRRPVLSQQ